MSQTVTTLKKRQNQRRRFIFICLLPTLICYAVFYLYSIVTVFVSSFMKWDYSNLNSPRFLDMSHIFDNYRYIFQDYPFFKEALTNSLIWAIAGVLVQVPLAVLVALALSKKLRGWKLVRNIYIIPSVISSAAMGLIFLQIYNPNYGIVTSLVKIINPNFTGAILLTPGWNLVAMTCAYIFFAGASCMMVLGQIFSVPQAIYEAAMLDGISGWRREWYITLPMIRDTIKTISVLAATSGFLLYNEVYFLTRGAAGTKSISYIIRDLAVGSSRTQYARANTIGVFQIIGGMLIILTINLIFRTPKKQANRLKAAMSNDKGGK